MWKFNDSSTKEEKCYNSSYNHVQSENCTGVIPVGEPHYRWDGLHSEDGTPARICRHCVRKMNDKTIKDEPILVKVELTYSNGKKRILEGNAADDWSHMAGSVSVFAAVHGCEFEPLPWKEVDVDK